MGVVTLLLLKVVHTEIDVDTVGVNYWNSNKDFDCTNGNGRDYYTINCYTHSVWNYNINTCCSIVLDPNAKKITGVD